MTRKSLDELREEAAAIPHSREDEVSLELHPRLIIVSGQPGSGKTTLAHRLAQLIGCPALCRDEIKEGMVHSFGSGFIASTNDPLTARTYPLFFECLHLLLTSGVTVVAEAAFQHHLWSRGLEPLADLAEIRILRCSSDGQTLLSRRQRRMDRNATRAAHADTDALGIQHDWTPIHLDRPTLDIDTTDGYRPSLAEIVAFCST